MAVLNHTQTRYLRKLQREAKAQQDKQLFLDGDKQDQQKVSNADKEPRQDK